MATVGWIDTQEVYDEVAKLCTSYNVDFEEKTTDIINRCVQQAYNTIVNKLVGRGYTLAQIGTWISREDYQRDIALCWSLKKVGFQRGDEGSEAFVDDFCKQDELDEINLVDEDGNDIEPSGDPESVFSVFDLEEINDSLDITLP
jgi:hypothetical protein